MPDLYHTLQPTSSSEKPSYVELQTREELREDGETSFDPHVQDGCNESKHRYEVSMPKRPRDLVACLLFGHGVSRETAHSSRTRGVRGGCSPPVSYGSSSFTSAPDKRKIFFYCPSFVCSFLIVL